MSLRALNKVELLATRRFPVAGTLAWATVLSCAAAAVAATAEAPPPAPVAPPAAAASSSRRCVQCHQFETGLSHPVDVTPSMRVTELPLEEGKVTCLTCHDPGALRGHDQKSGQGKSYIRDDEEGQSLCARCHTSKQTAGHTTAYPWAHPARKSARGGDRESDACLSCHDGALASDADAHRQRGLAEQTDHAVGTLFKAPPSAESALVPVARLDRRVRLFDGKIGCGSCHSVYAPGEQKLVVSNKASQLCLKCHVE